MKIKCKGSGRLERAAKEFCRAFNGAHVVSDAELVAIKNGADIGYVTNTDGTVVFRREYLDAAQNLYEEACALFGFNLIHRQSIEPLARNICFDLLGQNDQQHVAKAVAAAIGKSALTRSRLVRPNFLLNLAEGVDEVVFGPVRIVRRDLLKDDVASTSSSFSLAEFRDDPMPFNANSDGDTRSVEIYLPEVCWDVSLIGMEKNLEPQAEWLIDVSISCLRLFYSQSGGGLPGLKDIEPSPVIPRLPMPFGMVLQANRISCGGGTVPWCYSVDLTLANELRSTNAVEKIQGVFDAPQGSLGERLQQALGWMTRGRRAKEPAERMLLFFTALETLLTHTDERGAVADYIARSVAVLWSNDLQTRRELFHIVKGLYRVRSNIVHKGERHVADIEASNTHWIVTQLAAIILHRSNLHVPHNSFVEGLKNAFWGGKVEFDAN